jgi:hypothetical protein
MNGDSGIITAPRNHAANAGTHSFQDRGPDNYSTPPSAVEALLRVERLPHKIWEPAAGYGSIVKTLRAAGHDVIASDLHDWNLPGCATDVDFLTVERAPHDAECVVTNPPYRYAAEFVEHALDLVPFVLMLLRLQFLESERRSAILESGELARVHVFRHRLPMMHRHDWAGPKASSSIPFAWFVWDRCHDGPTTLHRISARREVAP